MVTAISLPSERRIGVSTLILLVATFIVAASNRTFFSHLLEAYPLGRGHLLSVMVAAALSTALLALLLSFLAWGRLTRPVLVGALLVSSLTAAFMDSYGVVIDDNMVRNVVRTNVAEAGDLINLKLLGYFVVCGIAPSLVVLRWPLVWQGWRRESLGRLKLMGALILVMVLLALSSGGFLASFIREHKSVRSYSNPAYPVYSLAKYVRQTWQPEAAKTLLAIGSDARQAPADKTRDLFILVVGETARADHFGLNGYSRDTTPALAQSGAVSLGNFWACGTSTAFSVPCIFSSRGADRYSPSTAGTEENLLDVLQRAGVNVVWLDNNSHSQGVADRSLFLDYRKPANNPVCDEECRDEGMLSNLQSIIDGFPSGDVFIVLHQMGNHGPAYYKRYPPAFERFKPSCKSNELGNCSREEIINAYDNAIAYTDDFLSKTIAFLKKNDKSFETAMLYVSDHGESLGENGVYLHGLPRAIAPDAQLHVPAVIWFGDSVRRVSNRAADAHRDLRLSHDNIFHTVLGFLEIETSIYRNDLDIVHSLANPHAQ